MRSVGALRDTLDGMTWQGVSQTAELARLSVLVRKYPDEARRLVALLDQDSAP